MTGLQAVLNARHRRAIEMRQVIVFANDFQKHSDLVVLVVNPLIDHALCPA